eukprot:5059046-Amphidinium_carterae.1
MSRTWLAETLHTRTLDTVWILEQVEQGNIEIRWNPGQRSGLACKGFGGKCGEKHLFFGGFGYRPCRMVKATR